MQNERQKSLLDLETEPGSTTLPSCWRRTGTLRSPFASTTELPPHPTRGKMRHLRVFFSSSPMSCRVTPLRYMYSSSSDSSNGRNCRPMPTVFSSNAGMRPPVASATLPTAGKQSGCSGGSCCLNTRQNLPPGWLGPGSMCRESTDISRTWLLDELDPAVIDTAACAPPYARWNRRLAQAMQSTGGLFGHPICTLWPIPWTRIR